VFLNTDVKMSNPSESPLILRSLKHDGAKIFVPANASDLSQSFNGSVCSNKGDEYKISENIIDLLGEDEYKAKSLAEHSNKWDATAALYEDIWRKNAVSFLSGKKFPWEKERTLMEQCLRPRDDELYLDIGCSTALYSRLLLKQAPKARVIAMDYSLPMLKKAREKCKEEGYHVFLLRGDAHEMPFFRGALDGAVCGGTLNELRDPLKVLFETRRILKDNARLFVMYLLKSDAWYLRLAQSAVQTGGLTFWSIDESKDLFKRSGFKINNIEREGLVCFACLTAA
jgi:ubiquinone/menaquinone biosynthesis C-methylase UbiE